MTDERADVVVVGAGLVGLATAYALLVRERSLRLVVLEAEDAPARHQSGRNSGVVHSGLYYRPGSAKARLCAEGRRLLERFLRERGLPFRRTGKLVVAVDESEEARLLDLHRRGVANGLEGLEVLDAGRCRAREPHVAARAGLFVPQTAVTDFAAVARALAAEVEQAGGQVRLGAPFREARAEERIVRVRASDGLIAASFLVSCAGLQADRVARRSGLRPQIRIVPFRGEFYELVPERRDLVRGLVYPVPDPRLPFLGVHWTRRLDGRVFAGPNATVSFRRDGYGRLAFSPRDVWEILSWPGFWRLTLRFPRTAVAEVGRSFSRFLFARAARRLVPAVRARDLRHAASGNRAQALDVCGRLLDDFAFARDERQLHVLNAPSPAATACLAIGRTLAEEALAGLEGAGT